MEGKDVVVFVSGCYDLLHSGHVEFFKSASKLGTRLIVALGSDATILKLKGKLPVIPEEERLFMVQSIRYVSSAFISSGNGFLDFEKEFLLAKPNKFVINDDSGATKEKQALCDLVGCQLITLKRLPAKGLLTRSTTKLRTRMEIPQRIDICGGWLDQPSICKLLPEAKRRGSVITLCIDSKAEFNARSGLRDPLDQLHFKYGVLSYQWVNMSSWPRFCLLWKIHLVQCMFQGVKMPLALHIPDCASVNMMEAIGQPPFAKTPMTMYWILLSNIYGWCH